LFDASRDDVGADYLEKVALDQRLLGAFGTDLLLPLRRVAIEETNDVAPRAKLLEFR
jgi:hypothetical protein